MKRPFESPPQGYSVETAGQKSASLKEVRLQHHRLDHHHRRGSRAARLLRPRPPIDDEAGVTSRDPLIPHVQFNSKVSLQKGSSVEEAP